MLSNLIVKSGFLCFVNRVNKFNIYWSQVSVTLVCQVIFTFSGQLESLHWPKIFLLNSPRFLWAIQGWKDDWIFHLRHSSSCLERFGPHQACLDQGFRSLCRPSHGHPQRSQHRKQIPEQDDDQLEGGRVEVHETQFVAGVHKWKVEADDSVDSQGRFEHEFIAKNQSQIFYTLF